MEYTAHTYRKPPNKAFFRKMSAQLSPKIEAIISDGKIRESVQKIVCLTVDFEDYEQLSDKTDRQSIRMFLESVSAPFRICSLTVLWKTNEQHSVFPWEDFADGSVDFDMIISDAEIKKLNRTLPELFHPLIKPETSGLSFDY